MKYLKKERVEIQEVYLMYISYIEKNLTSGWNFLCCMDNDIGVTDLYDEFTDCGLNNRMLPNAITYLKSEKPTKVRNKVIYDLPLFIKKERLTNDSPWWYYDSDSDTDTVNIAVNREKIIFLQHLIKKLI